MDLDQQLSISEIGDLMVNLWDHEERYDNDGEIKPLLDVESIPADKNATFSVNDLIQNAETGGDRVLFILNTATGEVIYNRKKEILAEERAWEEAMENEASKSDDDDENQPDAELDAIVDIETLRSLEVWMFNHEAGGPDNDFKKACDELDIEHFEKFDVVTVRDVLDDIEFGGDRVISLRAGDGSVLLDRQQEFADEGHTWAMDIGL